MFEDSMNDFTSSLARDIMSGPKRREKMNRDPTVRLGKNGLSLFIPGQQADGHHVEIPLTLDGLRTLRGILEERAREERSTIGMRGSPTQGMVDAFLRTAIDAKRKEIAEEKAAEARERAARIVPGLDLSTLKL